MKGGARHLPSGPGRDPLERLLATLLFQPGAILAVGAYLFSAGVGLPTTMGIVLASVAGGLGLAWHLRNRHFSVSARVRVAMVEMGLVCRIENGELVEPRQKGRAVRFGGENLHLVWKLPPGVTFRDVLDSQEAIEHRLVCELYCWMDGGFLHMDVLRHRIPDLVPFDTFYRGDRSEGRLLLGLGVGHRGPLWVDLAGLPHLLVGGMTSAGKSVFLCQGLTGILLAYSPGQVRLLCIDLKRGVELHPFAELPHSLGPVVDSIEAAADALAGIRSQLDHRLDELRRSGLRDITAWNADHRERIPWPRLLVVVDEVAELTTKELGSDKAATDARRAAVGRLVELARLGRAGGIHLILCTQRPDADAVPGQLKANMAGTVAFRVRADVNSQILLESDRAALLPPLSGRAIWAHERLEEFQAVYVDPAQSARLLAERWGGARGADSPSGSAAVTPTRQTPVLNSEDANYRDGVIDPFGEDER